MGKINITPSLNGTTTVKTFGSGFSLVNSLPTLMGTILGFMVNSVRIGDFEMAQHYLMFLIPIIILYLILRSPQILDLFLTVVLDYRIKKEKELVSLQNTERDSVSVV
jgi:ABC-type Na+ efflux pump permease subunit